MNAEERQQTILQQLNARGRLTIGELSTRFSVSDMTIRRDLAQLESAGLSSIAEGIRPLVEEFAAAIQEFRKVNADHPEESIEVEAVYMRDVVIPQMNKVRALADQLERIVADDLWPLPTYREMLFIK